jgi:uncharacterized protein DUF2569
LNNSNKKYVYCPNCGSELELDEEENKEGKFTCLECGIPIDLSIQKLLNFEEVTEIAQNRNSGSIDNYYGVGGWLLLFCIILTIFFPLSTLFYLTMNFDEARSYFNLLSKLETFTYIDIVLRTGLIVFSIYTGAALWSIKKDAVQLAKKFLIYTLVYGIISSTFPILIYSPTFVDGTMVLQIIIHIIRSIIFFRIWTSYLNKSKRVMNTYPKV